MQLIIVVFGDEFSGAGAGRIKWVREGGPASGFWEGGRNRQCRVRNYKVYSLQFYNSQIDGGDEIVEG